MSSAQTGRASDPPPSMRKTCPSENGNAARAFTREKFGFVAVENVAEGL